jgi:hypothetical protein
LRCEIAVLDLSARPRAADRQLGPHDRAGALGAVDLQPAAEGGDPVGQAALVSASETR